MALPSLAWSNIYFQDHPPSKAAASSQGRIQETWIIMFTIIIIMTWRSPGARNNNIYHYHYHYLYNDMTSCLWIKMISIIVSHINPCWHEIILQIRTPQQVRAISRQVTSRNASPRPSEESCPASASRVSSSSGGQKFQREFSEQYIRGGSNLSGRWHRGQVNKVTSLRPRSNS